MKVDGGEVLRASMVVRVEGFVLVAVTVTFFYLGKHWSDGYLQLIFFSSRQNDGGGVVVVGGSPSVTLSPNFNKSFEVNSLINHTQPVTEKALDSGVPPVAASTPPPPTPDVKRFGIVDGNGMMSNDFEVGEFDAESVENWNNGTDTEVQDDGERNVGFSVSKFHMCPSSMRESIPCLDNVEAIKKLELQRKGRDLSDIVRKRTRV